jgi:hypothetical protein
MAHLATDFASLNTAPKVLGSRVRAIRNPTLVTGISPLGFSKTPQDRALQEEIDFAAAASLARTVVPSFHDTGVKAFYRNEDYTISIVPASTRA